MGFFWRAVAYFGLAYRMVLSSFLVCVWASRGIRVLV